MKRTDVILSAGTLAVVLLAVVVVAATGAIDEFAAWAWARHHNELVHQAPLYTAFLLLRL
jgi:hypothetical protein